MIYGLFLDPRIWKIDYLTSPFWKPDEFGVHIDLHPDAFNIPKLGVDPKYKFVIATEVWEIPMRKTLQYLRDRGLKVFLVPREIAPTEAHFGIMFNEERFKFNGEYYFKPDAIFAPGEKYARLWDRKNISVEIIGYPRFDIYLRPAIMRTRKQIMSKYGIDPNKKIIFFPSYPPFNVQTINSRSVVTSLQGDLQQTLAALEKFSIENKNDVQVVVKIHPYSQKVFDKGSGFGDEVSGLLKRYYKNPTSYMKVIGDQRMDSSVSREMIIASDIVIGYTSMMLLEGIINDKPIIHLKMQQAQSLKFMPEYEEEIHTTYNTKEMHDALVECCTNMRKYVVKNSKLVERYLYRIDGKFNERLCKLTKHYLGAE